MTRLHHKSKQRAAYDAVASKWRRDFLEEVGRCDWCGCRNLKRLSVHEVTQGYGPRRASLMERAALLVLCDGFANNCHARIHALGKQGKVVALALLFLNRPSDFDLDKVHTLRGDKWPELADVMREVKRITELKE